MAAPGSELVASPSCVGEASSLIWYSADSGHAKIQLCGILFTGFE